jgi:hypothetical protein
VTHDAGSTPLAPAWRRWVYLCCRAGLVLLFLAWFASFHRPGFGFTYVLFFNQYGADTRIDTLRGVPIYVHPGAGYDGMAYVQLAVDPLVRDPSIDAALDLPAFRARRILFCWTAWLLGLGRPAWVVQAYCVQNALWWLVFAAWLRWRLPADTIENFVVWAACLFTPGMLDSARMALLDGPSLLVVAFGADALERGRIWTGSIILGAAGLARETNLLTGAALLPPRHTPRAWLTAVGSGALFLLPSALWLDYLRSIYRSHITQSLNQLSSAPFVAYLDAWRTQLPHTLHSAFLSPRTLPWLTFAAMTAQALSLLVAPRWRSPWWRIGVAFIGLMLVIHPEIWLSAYRRVLLPLTLAFNLHLPRDRRFWPLFALGNLGLLTSAHLLMA